MEECSKRNVEFGHNTFRSLVPRSCWTSGNVVSALWLVLKILTTLGCLELLRKVAACLPAELKEALTRMATVCHFVFTAHL